MRRVRHVIFNALAVLSLVLVALVAGLWVRSYWVADFASFSRLTWSLSAGSGGGQFRFELTRARPRGDFIAALGFHHSTDRADGPIELGERMPGSRSHFKRFGFWIVTGERWGDDHDAAFAPAWFVEGLLVAFAAPSMKRLYRLRARLADECPACGYNLRATPERCPECGTARVAA